MRKLLISAFFVLSITGSFSQSSDVATDQLTPAFHAGRRDSARARMPANTVMAIFASPVRNFANDVDYVYHQNPDLYYFTGYTEPHAVLFLFKEPQKAADGSEYKELFFVQERNARAEQWTGRRMGVDGVKAQLQIQTVFNGREFRHHDLDFSGFSQIIMDRLPDTNPSPRPDSTELYSLMTTFLQKAGITAGAENARVSAPIYRQITGALREIKTDEELVLLRKAIEISCIAQAEVMKAIGPHMSEREVQGLHEFVHKKYGAENVGYPSIVGAGNNGCVLHYIENSKLQVGKQMLLMDVGAEYHGYTADVTRTIPANGKFTAEQKAIYEIVYQAQEECFRMCKEGTAWRDVNLKSREIVAAGLLKLGIIKKKEDVTKYYPHGLGHHIGLDVHDRNASSVLKKNMVLTVEPGIYIPENSDCDKKWWGIAVRIEDDVLIREKDCELLSTQAPRSVADIEKKIAEKSILDNYVLPKLESAKKAF